ncbi:MAG: hypothetical protein ACI30V_02160, partial [Muribaculaceae bacterium]
DITFKAKAMMTRQKSLIKHLTDKQCMWFVTMATVLLTFLWFSLVGIELYHVYGDTGTYLAAGRKIFSGTIDELRTPVYPVLCQLFTLGKYFNGLYLLSAFQMLIFFVSVPYFYKTFALLTQRKTVKCVFTCLYAWNLPILNYTAFIFTESLTISSVVFFAYMLISIVMGKASRSICIAMPLLLLFMIMLRPFCICFVPLGILAYAYAYHEKTLRHTTAAISSTLIATIIVLGYCAEHKRLYGRFALSNVSSINRAIVLIRNGMLSEPFPPYETLVELQSPDSARHIRCWRVEQAKLCLLKADSVYTHNLLKYATSRVSAFDKSLDEKFPACPHHVSADYLHHVQCFNLSQIYLIIAILVLVQAILMFRRPNILAIIGALMTLACMATIATTLWACADNNFARLMTPMFPYLCLLAACIVEQLDLRLKPTSTR